MSRHTFIDGDTLYTVGYDRPLATYFAQAEPHPASDEDEPRTLFGDQFGEVPTIEGLVNRLPVDLRLPDDVYASLALEDAVAPAPVERTAEAVVTAQTVRERLERLVATVRDDLAAGHLAALLAAEPDHLHDLPVIQEETPGRSLGHRAPDR